MGVVGVNLGGNNTSTFNYTINSVTTDANDNLYATGGFTNSKGKNYVAEYKQ
jgi:hypothetical protein